MQKLNILICSDLHEQSNYVESILKQESNQQYDYILLLGDFLNIQHNELDQTDQQSEIKLKQLIEPFIKLSNQVYFIPGNHDYQSLFNGQQIHHQIKNIEKQYIQLAHNLYLYAIGGSIPGFIQQNMVWKGYPYNSDQEFKKQFQLPIIDQHQVILMTHIGPIHSQTTVSFELGINNQIQSGSQYLSETILKNTERILLNVHGHTHDGLGSRLIGQTRVVNPGPLLLGHYAKLKLVLTEQKWKIVSIEHLQL